MKLNSEQKSKLDEGLLRLIQWADAETYPGERWKVPDIYLGSGYAAIDAVMTVQQDYEKTIRPMMKRLQDKLGKDAVGIDLNWLVKTFDDVAPIKNSETENVQPSKKNGDLDELIKALVAASEAASRPKKKLQREGSKGKTPRGEALGDFLDNHSESGGRMKGEVIYDLANEILSYRSSAVTKEISSTADYWSQMNNLSPEVARQEKSLLMKHMQEVFGVGPKVAKMILILFGDNYIAPDMHIIWFFENHTCNVSGLSADAKAEEIEESAERLRSKGLTSRDLREIDYLIWNQASTHVRCPDGKNC